MINSQASGRAGGSTSITRLSSTASQAIRDNIHRNLPRSPFRFINRVSYNLCLLTFTK